MQAEVDGLDAGDAELTERHEAAKRALSEAEAALSAAREAATAAERRRAATQARHEALALGLRRKDGTGALLGARDRLTGLLGPAAELLSVTPGHEVALAAAFGAAADAIAVTTPASAAEAIRLLRKQDAGRAALLLARAPEEAGIRETRGIDGTGQHGAAGDSTSRTVPGAGHPGGVTHPAVQAPSRHLRATRLQGPSRGPGLRTSPPVTWPRRRPPPGRRTPPTWSVVPPSSCPPCGGCCGGSSWSAPWRTPRTWSTRGRS